MRALSCNSSELTSQTIPVAIYDNFKTISQILKSMHKGYGFSAKTCGKSRIHFQSDW